MVIRYKKIFPNIQLFQQYESQNGHLQPERKGHHLVARSEIGKGIKIKTDGIVRLQEIFQETIPV
jgi:hypothetical protein